MLSQQKKLYEQLTKAPSWCKDAILDAKGWRHPKTKELLVSRRIPLWVIEAYNSSKELQEIIIERRAEVAVEFTSIEEPIEEPQEIIPSVVEDEIEEIEDTSKPKKRGRPRKMITEPAPIEEIEK